MILQPDLVMEPSTSFSRNKTQRFEISGSSASYRTPFTQKCTNQIPSRKRVRCQASDDWMSAMANNLVLNPDKFVQSGATYLFGGSALIACAVMGFKVILWDYKERRSDDPERFADLTSPFQGIELQKSSQGYVGVFWNLLRFYDDPFDNTELTLTEEETKEFVDQPFTVDDWSASANLMRLFMKSTLREWNALAFAAVTWLLAQHVSLSPRITWFLLEKSNQTASNPPKRDWRPPLSSAFATNDVMEGATLHSLQMFMRSRTMCYLLQRLHTLYQSSSAYEYEA